MLSLRKALALSAAGVVLLAGTASAHVTVNADGATQGGFTKLVFRVPTELDSPTVKVTVKFPADAPLGFASVKPHPGWTYTETKVKPKTPITTDDGQVDQVVDTITWTATAGGIKPGEFDEFEVSAGPLPEVDQMVFKAIQTYGNGTVVSWIEEPAPGSTTEPEHPAPTLELAKADSSADGGHDAMGQATPAASAAGTTAPSVTATASESKDDDSKTLAGLGLGFGILALLVALAALAGVLRGRPRTKA